MTHTSPHYKKLLMVAVLAAFALVGTLLLSNSSAGPKDPNDPNYPIADTNGDNTVNIFDLSYMLNRWNTNNTTADFTSDGLVNIFDLSYLLAQWQRVDVPGGDPTDYLSQGNPCPAHQYEDLSDPATPCEDRYLDVGADEAALNALYETGNEESPGCSQAAVTNAINSISAAGGGVVNLPACTINVNSTITVKGNVVLKGAGVGLTKFYNPTQEVTLYPLRAAGTNIVLEDFEIDSNLACGPSIQFSSAFNALAQRVKVSGSQHMGIQIFRSQDITVRYADVQNGRGATQNSSSSNACTYGFGHGIGSKDCWSAAECASVTPTRDVAVYSNILSNNDAYGLDLHSDFSEAMGNVMDNNTWGAKFVDAVDFMFHDNRVSNVAPVNWNGATSYPFQIYGLSLAGDPDNMVIFNNVFVDNGGGNVRFDGWPGGGSAWLLNNQFINSNIVSSVQYGSYPLNYCSGAEEAERFNTGNFNGTGAVWQLETNASICSLDRQALIGLTIIPPHPGATP